jgi:SAM-dependent methyltransferase
MDVDDIRQYWEGRASSDGSAQSTTNDVYLREIEYSVVNDAVAHLKPESVLDVGCGDARTTARLAASNAEISFAGIDYSESMISNAKAVIAELGLSNLKVVVGDATKPISEKRHDLVYTNRCLINLPTWDLQRLALENIAKRLPTGKHFLMIENFVEGQQAFNATRRKFGLPEIPVRSHNCFFRRDQLLGEMEREFVVVEERNISSTYYLVSRVIYARICMDEGKSPDYFDAHHKYAAQLPFLGECGPVRALLFRKR